MKSSHIVEMGYDAATFTLEVAFPPSGSTGLSRVYQYTPVPPQVYDMIKSAPSIGRAFNEFIVKAKVPYERKGDVALRSPDEAVHQ